MTQEEQKEQAPRKQALDKSQKHRPTVGLKASQGKADCNRYSRVRRGHKKYRGCNGKSIVKKRKVASEKRIEAIGKQGANRCAIYLFRNRSAKN